jgi:serine protease Do
VQFEGEEPMSAEIVSQDAKRDIALLRVRAPNGKQLRPVVFGPGEVRRGQEVAAFGYPMGNPSLILTRGGVSGRSGEGLLILDCLVNPGNSGGPLCDTAGRVIGMVTAKSSNSETVDSYGLALPVDVVRTFLEQTLPGRNAPGQPPSERQAGWEQVNHVGTDPAFHSVSFASLRCSGNQAPQRRERHRADMGR